MILKPNTVSKIILYLITPFIIINSTEKAFSHEKIVLTTHNLYPYGSFDESDEEKRVADEAFKGYAVDVVRCVLEKMNVPFEIQVLPWKRAQVLVQNGKAHGFFAASHKASRDDFAVLSAVIADQKWQWYLLKEYPLAPDHPFFKTITSVGGFRGANMLYWMEENGYHVKARPNNTKCLLKMLLGGRVDAVMANNYVMDSLIRKYGVGNRVNAFVHKDKPLGVYFSKVWIHTHKNFLSNFNQLVPGCRRETF